MANFKSFLTWCSLAPLGFSANALAATLQVDAKPGAAEYHTIQAALDKAKAGDTIHVKAGVYQERVKFQTGGTEGQPVVLEGEPGTIIDGSNPVKLDWQPAPDLGPSVYRAAVDFLPFTVTANGKLVTTLDEKRVDPALPHDERDNLRWPEIFRKGTGPSGWSGVVAVAMYLKKEKQLLIRFKGGVDPRTLSMTVGPREPCITIDGQNYCVIRGITTRYAATGISVENSIGTVVENSFIGPVDYGVYLGKGTDRCIVRFCELTMAPYSGADPWREEGWDNWQAHKNAGFYDRYALHISEGKGHDIHDNFIHDCWDGIETGFPGSVEENGSLMVHHNFIYQIFDDAIETSGGQSENQWYDNLIERARIAIRIKNPAKGPFYIYRNVFLENKSDMTVYSGKFLPPDVELWAYQNTCTADVSIGTNYAQKSPPVTTKNYHFYNNIFWCLTTLRREPAYPLPDWKSDGNVFIRATPESPRMGDSRLAASAPADRLAKWEQGLAQNKQAGIDQLSAWIADGPTGFADGAKGNLALVENSPARGAGVDLSKVAGRALPGLEPGYFKGERPDAGALQFGSGMITLPRKTAMDSTNNSFTKQ